MIVEKAKAYAYKKHEGQFRKGKTVPFITHLEKATKIAEQLTADKEIIAATWLHDVVEDTDASHEDILLLFGKRISHFVKLESENKRENLDEKDTWRIRKEEQLENLKNISKEDEDVYIIALSDKLANISEMHEDLQETTSDEFWNRFNNNNLNDHHWYYSSFYDIVKNHKIVSKSKELKLFRTLIEEVFQERD